MRYANYDAVRTIAGAALLSLAGTLSFAAAAVAAQQTDSPSKNPLVVDGRDWSFSDIYSRVQQTRRSVVIIVWGGTREMQQSAYNGALDLRDRGAKVVFVVGKPREDREMIDLAGNPMSLQELREEVDNLAVEEKFREFVRNYARLHGTTLAEAESEMLLYFRYVVAKRNVYLSDRDDSRNPSIYIELAGCGETRTVAWDALAAGGANARELVRNAGLPISHCLIAPAG